MRRDDVHYVALAFSDLPAPDGHRRRPRTGCGGPASTGGSGSAQGTFPDHPWRVVPAVVGAGAQGPVLRADRRAARRGDHVAAGNPWRGTELGLPLHLDPGLHLRPVGPVHARLRPRGQRLLLLHPRRLPGQPQRPADHVRRRRRAAPGGGHPRPPDRLRRRPAGADRQRRLQPAAARRLGCPARLDLPAHPLPRADARGAVADRHRAGRAGRGALAGAGPRHLGGARRAAALHRVQDHVLGGAGPRRPAGPAARLATTSPTSGRRSPTRSTPTSWPTASTSAACWSSGTAPTPWTRPCCSPRWSGSCRRTTRGSGPPCWPSPTSSPTTGWCCATGWRRPTTVWPARRAPSPSARSGWCRRWWRSARTSGPTALCERLLSHASILGLYAEELDPVTGRHLGNFPQAFTHLALINAVTHVIRAEERRRSHGFAPANRQA